jgi:hypothetical protein
LAPLAVRRGPIPLPHDADSMVALRPAGVESERQVTGHRCVYKFQSQSLLNVTRLKHTNTQPRTHRQMCNEKKSWRSRYTIKP